MIHFVLGRELSVDTHAGIATIALLDEGEPVRLGVLELDRQQNLWRSSLTNTLDNLQNHLELLVRHHQRMAALKK